MDNAVFLTKFANYTFRQMLKYSNGFLTSFAQYTLMDRCDIDKQYQQSFWRWYCTIIQNDICPYIQKYVFFARLLKYYYFLSINLPKRSKYVKVSVNDFHNFKLWKVIGLKTFSLRWGGTYVKICPHFYCLYSFTSVFFFIFSLFAFV